MYLLIIFIPLIGSIFAGLFGRQLTKIKKIYNFINNLVYFKIIKLFIKFSLCVFFVMEIDLILGYLYRFGELPNMEYLRVSYTAAIFLYLKKILLQFYSYLTLICDPMYSLIIDWVNILNIFFLSNIIVASIVFLLLFLIYLIFFKVFHYLKLKILNINFFEILIFLGLIVITYDTVMTFEEAKNLLFLVNFDTAYNPIMDLKRQIFYLHPKSFLLLSGHLIILFSVYTVFLYLINIKNQKNFGITMLFFLLLICTHYFYELVEVPIMVCHLILDNCKIKELIILLFYSHKVYVLYTLYYLYILGQRKNFSISFLIVYYFFSYTITNLFVYLNLAEFILSTTMMTSLSLPITFYNFFVKNYLILFVHFLLFISLFNGIAEIILIFKLNNDKQITKIINTFIIWFNKNIYKTNKGKVKKRFKKLSIKILYAEYQMKLKIKQNKIEYYILSILLILLFSILIKSFLGFILLDYGDLNFVRFYSFIMVFIFFSNIYFSSINIIKKSRKKQYWDQIFTVECLTLIILSFIAVPN
jgi:hypothetical protein